MGKIWIRGDREYFKLSFKLDNGEGMCTIPLLTEEIRGKKKEILINKPSAIFIIEKINKEELRKNGIPL